VAACLFISILPRYSLSHLDHARLRFFPPAEASSKFVKAAGHGNLAKLFLPTTLNMMRRLVPTMAALQVSLVLAASLAPLNFTVPGAFPTSIFSKYYNQPTATSAQVQPVVSDPVTVAFTLFLYLTFDPNLRELKA
jgi:hypothetical protein